MTRSPSRRGPRPGRRRRPCSGRRRGRSRRRSGRWSATRRSTSAGVSTNVPACGWNAIRRAGRDGLRRERVEQLRRVRPSRRRSARGVPGSSARPAQASRVRRAVEGDARAPRRRRRRGGASARGPAGQRIARRSVDRRRNDSVDLGEAEAARGEGLAQRVALGEADAELGARRTRSGRSRRGSSARRSRGAGRRGRRCSRGSARCRSSASAGRRPAVAAGDADGRAGRRRVPRRGDGHRCCSSATPASQRACCSAMVFRARGVPPAGLVRSGDREVAVDRDVDERRAARGQRALDGAARPRRVVGRARLWIPNARPIAAKSGE